MERRENDKLLPEHAKDASYPEDWWLDEADSADGLPVFAMDEAEDFVKDRQRLKGVPMVTGYEALERHRGIRRPRRKLSRREQRAWEKAQKYEAKLHKAQEKEDKKRAKQEAKLAAREEKAAKKQAKKENKYKINRLCPDDADHVTWFQCLQQRRRRNGNLQRQDLETEPHNY